MNNLKNLTTKFDFNKKYLKQIKILRTLIKINRSYILKKDE